MHYLTPKMDAAIADMLPDGVVSAVMTCLIDFLETAGHWEQVKAMDKILMIIADAKDEELVSDAVVKKLRDEMLSSMSSNTTKNQKQGV